MWKKKMLEPIPTKLEIFKKREYKTEEAMVAEYDPEETKRVGKKLNNDPVDLDA